MRLLTPPDATGTRVWTQQRPAPSVGGAEITPSPAVIAELNRLAAQDPSSLVRLVLSSTMQRMPFSLRPARGGWVALAQGGCHRQESSADGLVGADSDRADAILRRSRRSARRANCARPASTSRGASLRTSTRIPAPVNQSDCRGDRPRRGLPVRHRGRHHARDPGPAGVAKPVGVGCVREDERAPRRMPPSPKRSARWMYRSAAPPPSSRRARWRSMARRPPRPGTPHCSHCSTPARRISARSRNSW